MLTDVLLSEFFFDLTSIPSDIHIIKKSYKFQHINSVLKNLDNKNQINMLYFYFKKLKYSHIS